VIFRSRTVKAELLEPLPPDSNPSLAQAEGLCYQKNGSEDPPLQALAFGRSLPAAGRLRPYKEKP